MSRVFTSVLSFFSGTESRFRFKPTLWGSLLITLAVAVYFRLSWPSFGDFTRAIDFCDIAFCDFVTLYYGMGKEIFLSKSPVLGYYYSPFFALLLGFFGFFFACELHHSMGCPASRMHGRPLCHFLQNFVSASFLFRLCSFSCSVSPLLSHSS